MRSAAGNAVRSGGGGEGEFVNFSFPNAYKISLARKQSTRRGKLSVLVVVKIGAIYGMKERPSESQQD